MSTIIRIEVNEETLRHIVIGYLQNKLGEVDVDPDSVRIQVKSKQNYRSEWEEAAYRAVIEKSIE